MNENSDTIPLTQRYSMSAIAAHHVQDVLEAKSTILFSTPKYNLKSPQRSNTFYTLLFSPRLRGGP